MAAWLPADRAGAAALLRAAGHEVITPDLYGGQTAGTLDAALALMDTHRGFRSVSHDVSRP